MPLFMKYKLILKSYIVEESNKQENIKTERPDSPAVKRIDSGSSHL